MADISKCHWEDCKIKNFCRRYMAKANEFRQSYTKWEYTELKWCDLFLK